MSRKNKPKKKRKPRGVPVKGALCPCGSGHPFKTCCFERIAKTSQAERRPNTRRLWKTFMEFLLDSGVDRSDIHKAGASPSSPPNGQWDSFAFFGPFQCSIRWDDQAQEIEVIMGDGVRPMLLAGKESELRPYIEMTRVGPKEVVVRRTKSWAPLRF